MGKVCKDGSGSKVEEDSSWVSEVAKRIKFLSTFIKKVTRMINCS
jgi:hypothetical protein